MGHKQSIMVKPAELLGLWPGSVDGLAHVFISLRLDIDSFEVTNIALSGSQARRLIDDLASRFEKSAILTGAEPLDPEMRYGFDRLDSESEHY